ncbi:hypothetical protein AMELA_G00284160 [Ameiurus melas]|uniref:Kazal-type serine protease inhibitor domain-containing protein n=1 Tax=Ameiurus melas TaxID=219545 RepID=A0A7J5ZI48_AMEME|nr:hypothetical protein AMELA_G00284160 [Ameiurus melas]
MNSNSQRFLPYPLRHLAYPSLGTTAEAEHGAYQWPESVTAACPQCSLWTTCDEQTNTCRCKTLDECTSSSLWINICVRLTEDAEVSTVTECEVGVRRFRGETPRILTLQTCEV